ncbi:hypothetical protein M413DRAFT_7834 [Hebeloma cylindrosporum]|uniref:Uncharacterized protein n=1 Tax=Hebeloma cylindrosporum TaxID=76867 RepID=A0A0C3CTV9_HEBCY|nr:hypothetical protein M413DRAFT_7834 [Hebeloma cylindrosporum h7]
MMMFTGKSEDRKYPLSHMGLETWFNAGVHTEAFLVPRMLSSSTYWLVGDVFGKRSKVLHRLLTSHKPRGELRSLYRLHDVLCANKSYYVMVEGQYFFRRTGWRLKEIPDPKDPNPLRYAILASLVESMVESYNYKISKGARREKRILTAEENKALWEDPNKPFEAAPSWTSHVPPLEEWTSFLEDRVIVFYNTPFCKRRICADASQLEHI